jgi:hypothetical protein
MCEIDWLAVVEISKSMLTPIIGIAASVTGIATVVIARQQKIINQQKLVLDKYDRRIKVYEEVTHFIRTIRRTGKVTDDLLFNYENTMAQSHFLFEPDIIKYIEEIYDHSRQLEYWAILYETTSMGHDAEGHSHADVCTNSTKEKKWFIAQLDVAKQKFMTCLYVGG